MSYHFLALATLLFFLPPVRAANYCLALRGNGELEPAHWGAVASVVERLGLPQAQAGGSSASITMFLLDAVASNPILKDHPSRLTTALMVKSFEGFADFLMRSPQFRDFQLLYGEAQKLKDLQSLNQIEAILNQARLQPPLLTQSYLRQQSQLLRSSLQTAQDIGLINVSTLETLRSSIELLLANDGREDVTQAIQRTQFQVSELLQTIRVFGRFDAATDANLFFRPGLVDFKQLATQLGRVGDFYAHPSASEIPLWQELSETCAAPSEGKLWREMSPQCQNIFEQLLKSHFAQVQDRFSEQTVGARIPSFPTTAVLTGQAVDETRQALARYKEALDPQFGTSFRLSNPEQVKFGYWGHPSYLNKISLNLPREDEKSRRFEALGQTSWRQVLALSPAEPGLSPLLPFEQDGRSYISAGGWSDLHPVLVLKAVGCENVVYVTRQGGESLFAQGVAKRLLGYDREWAKLRTTTPEDSQRNHDLNDAGDGSDLTSLWSRLYNLGNPESSFRRAIATADAVLCTNWDRYELKSGFRDMIADSYRSPYYVRSSRLQELTSKPDSSKAVPGCSF